MDNRVKELVEWVVHILEDKDAHFTANWIIAEQILSHPDLALAEKPKVICDGIGCKYLKYGTTDEGSYVTCTAKKCPIPKEFTRGWYNCQNTCGYRKVIPLAEAIKEMEK